MGTGPRPYLTFRVARQDLAMEAGRVRGILPLSALEPMPGVRPGLLGITSLNGQIVGVMDLRSKLKMPFSSQAASPKS